MSEHPIEWENGRWQPMDPSGLPPEWQCDCPEARLLRTFLALPEMEALDFLATTLAVWKLRSLSHEVAQSADWTRPATPYAERSRYEGPDESPEEIRRRAYRSWGMAPPGHE